MTPIEIAMAVNIAIQIGKNAWDFISKISEGKIPSYEELFALNDGLQKKIDSQKI